jgi:hypothetical protein
VCLLNCVLSRVSRPRNSWLFLGLGTLVTKTHSSRKLIQVGRTVGRTIGRTVGRTIGRTVGRTVGRTIGRTIGLQTERESTKREQEKEEKEGNDKCVLISNCYTWSMNFWSPIWIVPLCSVSVPASSTWVNQKPVWKGLFRFRQRTERNIMCSLNHEQKIA